MAPARALIVGCLTLCCALMLAPATASAVTIDQIVTLSRAGVADAVIVALIERDRTVFALDPAQLIELQQAGVSEPVTVAMLRSAAPPTTTTPAPDVVAPDIVAYTVAVPARRARSRAVAPVPQAAPAASSARGIFFSTPATGIFFAPPPAPDCPPPAAAPHRR
jgi:hypothetical protein